MLEDSSWLSNQEEGQDLLVFRADHSLSPSRLLSAPCRPTRELHRGRVEPGARGLQLWPAGLWRRFHRLQADHLGAETAGYGAGADRGRRADGKLVRGAAEEGGVQRQKDLRESGTREPGPGCVPTARNPRKEVFEPLLCSRC